MRRSNYSILRVEKDRVLLTDLGPWDQYLTITNDAEQVVEDLVPSLRGRRLFYYDSEGELTELLIKDGVFAGFGG